MKSELINLLDRLKNHPGPGYGNALDSLDGRSPIQREWFQSITIFPNGTAQAQYRHGIRQFANLSELEALAYPDSAARGARNDVGPVPSPGESPKTP